MCGKLLVFAIKLPVLQQMYIKNRRTLQMKEINPWDYKGVLVSGLVSVLSLPIEIDVRLANRHLEFTFMHVKNKDLINVLIIHLTM